MQYVASAISVNFQDATQTVPTVVCHLNLELHRARAQIATFEILASIPKTKIPKRQKVLHHLG